MKVLFIIKSTSMHERLGIMTLSSILKRQEHVVRLLITENKRIRDIIREVKKINPEVLAYSAVTGEHNFYINLNQKIKEEFSCFSVFGGPHPTFMPTMIEKLGIDAICRGEGDIYFPQLLEAMKEDRNFSETPNFWIKQPDGSIVKNEIGPLVDNLDELPFPDRRIMYNADPALGAKGNKLFMTMRGCPYKCSYCFNHAYNQLTKNKGELLRYRSVDNVIEEMKDVQLNYFLDRIFIDDDTFLLKPDGWLETFAERYPAEVGVPITCNVRCDLVNKEKVKLLKQMGCRHVYMGVETPDRYVATQILNRKITQDQVLTACSLFHQHGIRVITQSILGLPVENPLETDLATLDFNIKLKPDFAWSNLLFPYDGTDIQRTAIKKNMFDQNYEKYATYNQTESALTFKDLTVKRKIINLSNLFGLIVQFPFLRPLTPLLISLPFKNIYALVFYTLFGYKLVKHSHKKKITQVIRNYLPFYFKRIIG